MRSNPRATALEAYERLEATGLWRDRADAQRREVMVSLGEATLVISTIADTALSHWSLPAVERRNPGQRPAIYAPGPDSDETVEIAEPAMIDAIERLRGAIAQARPHPGRLRYALLALVIAFGTGLAVFWLPDALKRQTAALLPEAKRAELGAGVLSEMAMLSGQACTTPEGEMALAELSRRVLGPDGPRIAVLPDAVAGITHLPGNLFVIDRSLVEAHETPEFVAGHLLAEDMRRAEADPVLSLLSHAGLGATFRLLTTGQMRQSDLHAYATTALTTRGAPVPDAALIARFEAAEISSAAYAYGIDISGETTLTLIEGDPMRGVETAPLLRDQSWIALQEICVR